MRRITLIALAMLVLLVATAKSSFACTCPLSVGSLKSQVKQAFKNSSAIFSGEVISITPQSDAYVAVKIKVGKWWKGKLGEEVIITTPQTSAMCGYTFETGKTYIIYANAGDEGLMTTNCSRTIPATNKRDVKQLDKLKRQNPKSS